MSNRRSESYNSNDRSGVPRRSVAAHVRDRQRAVAEREASRLARPDERRTTSLQHADRKKSAVSSTPFGVHKITRDVETPVDEWCGPWSVARQMIAKREEVKRKLTEERESVTSHPLDALMDEYNDRMERKFHPSLEWKGDLPPSTPASIYAKRQKRANVGGEKHAVPLLSQLCVDFVVSNFQYVESLGDIGNDVRVDITKELISRNLLNAKALEALIEPTMETLEIVDCSGISQEALAAVLPRLNSLRYVLLSHAGRALGPLSVRRLIDMKPILCCLSVAGAYLLTDEDAAKLIQGNPTLQSLNFDTCPLIRDISIGAVSNCRNLLELSLQELNLSDAALRSLASSSDAFKSIKSLTLKSLTGLTDGVLIEILRAAASSLITLDISHNHDLSDACLSGVRKFNGNLKSLSMNGLKHFTRMGLLTFFTYALEGLPPPPKLKLLDVGSCDHEAVTDDILELICASCSATYATDNASDARTGMGGLVHLSIQGSSLVTDAALEQLATTSSQSLTELNVSYCPRITDKGLGYFVSKAGKQLTKICVWGCAQLSDEFFDGHSRVNDPSLDILGAWIKKSGGRSLR